YNGYRIWISIPTASYIEKAHKEYEKGRRMTVWSRYQASPQNVAEVFLHELAHIRGYHHDAIGRYITKADEKRAKEIVGDFKFEMKKPKPPKPKEDLQVRRYNHVIDMVTAKEKQIKRLQNQLTKWRRKKNYYERTLLAAGKIKEEV
ncbi:unnamed protein product, partial [marine sediment metagenome]